MEYVDVYFILFYFILVLSSSSFLLLSYRMKSLNNNKNLLMLLLLLLSVVGLRRLGAAGTLQQSCARSFETRLFVQVIYTIESFPLDIKRNASD